MTVSFMCNKDKQISYGAGRETDTPTECVGYAIVGAGHDPPTQKATTSQGSPPANGVVSVK